MSNSYKFNKLNQGKVGLKKYIQLFLGEENFWFFIKFECITLLCSWLPGVLGYYLRSKLYPLLLGSVGKGVIFGRNITLRHPRKIHIKDGTIIDDGCVLDAKGDSNSGISIGKNCYIGRYTIIYCKNGQTRFGDDSNVGHNCIVFSSNLVDIKEKVLIAAYSYIMSGGRYDFPAQQPFVFQETYSKGPTVIEENAWIGTKVVIVDGITIGTNSIIGAGSVVLNNIPPNCVAFGIPGKVHKHL